MHKVKVIGLVPACEILGDWVVSVVKSQAPWNLFFLALQPNLVIKLNSDWNVPFQSLSVKLKVHLIITFQLVLWCVLVKQCFHVIDDYKEIIFSLGHNLHSTKHKFQTLLTYKLLGFYEDLISFSSRSILRGIRPSHNFCLSLWSRTLSSKVYFDFFRILVSYPSPYSLSMADSVFSTILIIKENLTK